MAVHELPEHAGPIVPEGRIIISHVNIGSADQRTLDVAPDSSLHRVTANGGAYKGTIIEFNGQGEEFIQPENPGTTNPKSIKDSNHDY